MTGKRPRQAAGIAGFTLVEALVATALMGIVLSALATVTAQWLPNWNRGFARVQRSELLDVALERMVADLAAAEFITSNRETRRPLFEGSELSVTFVRSALGPNTRPGLEIVRMAETADRQGPALVRTKAPFAPSAAALAEAHLADPVVLLRSPYRTVFSYAGQDGVWKSTWLEARQLPSAVRLIVRDAASDRTLSISTATVVHVQLPAECVRKDRVRDCGRLQRPDGTTSDPSQANADADARPSPRP
jgi:general secretion pathway protein J